MPLLLTAAGVVVIVGLLFWLTEWLPENRTLASGENATAAGSEGTSGPMAAGGQQSTAPEAEPEASAGGTEAAAQETPPATEETGVIADAEIATGTDVGEAQPTAATTPPPLGSAYKTVLDSVTAWADAWSDQDVSRYLDAYSEGFTPGGGMSQRQWRAQRRQRLETPGFIKVSLSGLEIDRLDDDSARASFTQSYRSDRFSDTVRKTLELTWEDGRWKIAAEESS